jgi:hypothetical protein
MSRKDYIYPAGDKIHCCIIGKKKIRITKSITYFRHRMTQGTLIIQKSNYIPVDIKINKIFIIFELFFR